MQLLKPKGGSILDYKQIIQDSLDYIEDNLKTDITASELSDMAGFSLYHYYRVFQTTTGMSVKQYILRRRLLHAIYSVSRGETGIQAALTFGFDTYAGFYRAFIREFGCTPAVFVQNCRAKKPYRLNLKEEEHMTITRKKVSTLLKHWNMEQAQITDIYNPSTGEHNYTAYQIGDHYVLKFSANLGKLKNHIAVSKAIEARGLSAAVPVPTTGGLEYICDGEMFFCLTRRIPGSPLISADFYEDSQFQNANFVGRIIGQLHLALNTVDCCAPDRDLLETVASWALPKSKALLACPAGFWKEFLDTLTEIYPTLPRQIIHRDPQPGNIIHSDDNWGFVDFELSERNVRIYDPCYAATAILSESLGKDREKWPHILCGIIGGYDSVVHLTEAERRAIPYIILANQLICTAWFADQEKYADLLQTNIQMTNWIIDHFDDLKVL